MSSNWGLALYVFTQEKKEKCAPTRWGKDYQSGAFFFRCGFASVRPGGKAAERGPAKATAKKKKNQARALFFPSVTDNACKMVFSPSVVGKIHSFLFRDAAAWDLGCFPIRN